MNSKDLVENITSFCIQNSNKSNVEKYSKYFKEAHVAYGLTQPQMNTKAKELLKQNDITLEIVLKAAESLIPAPEYELPSLLLQVFNGKYKNYTRQTFTEVEKWFSIGIRNWAHADTLGMMILPKFILQNLVTLSDFKPWLTSPYKFQRRCVPVTLIKILKSNKTANFNPYFKFIEPLITDTERVVHQGVGWFLREAWKIKPAETEKFLLEWKNVAPRLIIQYATEKMTADQKLRFKRNPVND